MTSTTLPTKAPVVPLIVTRKSALLTGLAPCGGHEADCRRSNPQYKSPVGGEDSRPGGNLFEDFEDPQLPLEGKVVDRKVVQELLVEQRIAALNRLGDSDRGCQVQDRGVGQLSDWNRVRPDGEKRGDTARAGRFGRIAQSHHNLSAPDLVFGKFETAPAR